MKPLTFSQFHTVKDSFGIDTPNYPVVQAVLDGNNPGKVWMDDKACLVISAASYSFIAGSIPSQPDDEIVKILLEHKPIKLIMTSSVNILFWDALGFKPINRIQFSYPRSNLPRISQLLKKPHSSFSIQKINRDLFEKCNWKQFMLKFFGSAENYLEKGFGFCIVQGDIVLSEAHACYIGGGMVEIGYVTHESYRGKSLAAIISAHLIKECFARNLIPISSCEESNVASARTSEKLGFVEQMRYLFLSLL